LDFHHGGSKGGNHDHISKRMSLRARRVEVTGELTSVDECNCSICAKKAYLHWIVPRSNPDQIDVNARCLNGVDIARLQVNHFDGRNWEKSYPAYAERRDRVAAKS
jgi:hypothetical protein